MKNKIKITSFILTVLIAVMLAIIAKQEKIIRKPGNTTNFKKSVFSYPLLNQKSLSSQINFFSGEINVFPLPQADKIFQISTFYISKKSKPVITYNKAVNAKLLACLNYSRKIPGRNYWHIGLNNKIKHDFLIEARASKQNLNFTGIPIKKLNIKSGASRINIQFNQENPIEMNEFIMDAGASDVIVYGLSNARARKISINGATGKYILDFSGVQIKSTQVNLDGGISMAKLVIPKYLNTRIMVKDNLLKSIKISGFKKISKSKYQSIDFNPKKPILDLKIHLAAGQLIIINQ